MKTNIENTQSLLHDFGLTAKKTLGQNFLISKRFVLNALFSVVL